MNDLEKAARQALKALKLLPPMAWTQDTAERNASAITALRQALEQAEQEPVAWISKQSLAEIKDFDATVYGRGGFDDATPLYTEPPKREWVGLTTEQKIDIWEEYSRLTDSIIPTPEALFKVIETLLKEKNA